MKLFPRMAARRRLFRIYLESGEIPWRKPATVRRRRGGVYMGTREAIIPFLNKDAKRTIADLVLRPGYLIRDYIQRGRYEQYLAPFTALLVFYSVFTLLTAIVQPGNGRDAFGDSLLDAAENVQVDMGKDMEIGIGKRSVSGESVNRFFSSLFRTTSRAVLFTHLDLYPEAVDTPWKESLAAVEADLRSKGIPLFLRNFLLLWLAMALLLRKYGVSASGAAAASAYVLCQFCIFMFLALVISFGKSARLGVLIMGILLFIDYRQWLRIGNREALWLTVKTGLVYLVAISVFFLLLGTSLVLFAVYGAH